MEKLIFKKIIKDISLFLFVSITCVATIVWIIQAVNYLDLVSEDGHSLKVYFAYTLFSLPKILSNILPFMFMISLFYVIISYEINNELIIYWINGITKLNFANIIIKISILYFLIQIFLTTVVVPYSLDKGRSFFRTSNIDLFSSIIKEKKFIDTVEKLTIFVDKKEDIGQDDEIVEWDNTRFVVDETSMMYVAGTKIDWKEELFGSQFTIENPNAQSGCGCGESFGV